MSKILEYKTQLRNELYKSSPDWVLILALSMQILELTGKIFKIFKLLYYVAVKSKKGVEKTIFENPISTQ